MADKDMDFSGVTNPKRVIQKRLEEAGEDSRGGRDMGDIPNDKVQMSQAQFSGYSRNRTKDSANLAKALKNRKD